MRVFDVEGHKVQHQCVLFGKVYLFAIDVEGVYYMIKVNPEGTLDIL